MAKKINSTDSGETQGFLPRGGSLNPESDAEVTIDTLRETLERRQKELDSVRSEQAAVREQLAAAFNDSGALDAASILSLRSRSEELAVVLPLATLQERAAQRDFYSAMMQAAQTFLGPALAERDAAELAYKQAKERVDRAQSAATGYQVDAGEYRRLAMRVQQEMDSLKREFLRSEVQGALRAPVGVRDDLMAATRAEIALFQAGGKR